MNILWINRIIVVVTYILCLWVCEHFKISPMWCFVFATFYLIGMSFIFEIVEAVIK